MRRRAVTHGQRGLVLTGLLMGCTEPNPYLPVAGSGTGSGSGSTTESTTGPADAGSTLEPDSGPQTACAAAGHECVEQAPPGWEGPFAWLEQPMGGRPATCPAPWDQPLAEVFTDISAPAARCTCECTAFSGGHCGRASVTHYQQAGCVGPVLHEADVVPGCNELEGGSWSSGGSFWFDGAAIEGGGCVPINSAELVDATFLTRHLACGGNLSPEDCGAGRRCAPRPDDPYYPRWCVMAPGALECPDGPYTERTWLYGDIEDGRGCQPCACAPPRGLCLGTTLSLSTMPGCGLSGGFLMADQCTPGPGGLAIASLHHGAGAPQGICEPSVVVPDGKAEGIDPVTFCCTP